MRKGLITKWEVDQMGIDKVGIDKVGIDEVGRHPAFKVYLSATFAMTLRPGVQDLMS